MHILPFVKFGQCYPYFYDAGYLAAGIFVYLRSNLLIQKPVLLLIIGIVLVRYETQIGILVSIVCTIIYFLKALEAS